MYFHADSTVHGGDHRAGRPAPSNTWVHGLAQLTYRESLRDIETCLSVHASKLYHMGFRHYRSVPLDAGRCLRKARLAYPWALAQRLITQARTHTPTKNWALDLTNTVIRPGLDDHRSVPVGLSVGALPHHQGGGGCTRCSTCGATFRVLSTARMASCTTFMPSMLLPEAGAITSWIVATSTLPAFMCCTKPGPSSSRVPVGPCGGKSNIDAHRVYSAPADRSTISDQTKLPGRLLHPSRTSAHPLQGPRVRQDAGLHHQQLLGRQFTAAAGGRTWAVIGRR